MVVINPPLECTWRWKLEARSRLETQSTLSRNREDRFQDQSQLNLKTDNVLFNFTLLKCL